MTLNNDNKYSIQQTETLMLITKSLMVYKERSFKEDAGKLRLFSQLRYLLS